MKKFFIIPFLFITLIPLFSSFYSVETEHFEFIYDEKSRESAVEVIEKSEEYYSALVSFFSFDPHLSIPVYIRDDKKQYNAYYSSFPYSHIVLYDTIPPLSLLSNSKSSLSLTFLHELTHAFTSSIKSKGVSFISSVFGDSFIPGSLYMYKSFTEGIAVLMESRDGEGRLNDSSSLSILNQVVAENIDISYMDIAGGRLTYPGGNLSYILGSSFLLYLSETYGEEKTAAFIKECYLFPLFSTTQSIFKRTYSITLSQAWNDFLKSREKRSVKEPYALTEYGLITNLTLNSSNIYFKDRYTSSLSLLIEGGERKDICLSYSYNDELSFSSSYFLSPSILEEECRVNIKRMNGETVSSFPSYSSGLLITDEIVLLYKEENRNGYLDLYNIQTNERYYSISLERGVICQEFVLLPNRDVAFIYNREGREYLALLNLTSQSLSFYSFSPSLYIRSLSLNSDSTLSFSYTEREVNNGITKYGELDLSSFSYILSSDEYSGGINYPVKNDDTIYFVSSFFNGDKISSENVSSFTFSSPLFLEEVFFKEEEKKEISYSEKRYNPFLYLTKGTLLPLSVASSPYWGEDYNSFGFTYYTSDITERHSLILSLSTKKRDNYLYFKYQYKSLFSLSAFSSNSFTSLNANFSLEKNIGESGCYITLNDSIDFLFFNETIKVKNKFSFYYSSLHSSGIGNHEIKGLVYGFSLLNFKPSIFFSVYCPRLLPFSSGINITYNIPFSLSFSALLDKSIIIDTSIEAYLITFNLEKSINLLSLYLNRIELSTVVGNRVIMGERIKREGDFSLSLSLLFSPVLGSLSSSHFSLSLSYLRNTEESGKIKVIFALKD